LISVNLALIFILILLTAFFVAVEFAIVKVRRTRIEFLAAEGNQNAVATLRVLNDMDGYLSACQLGITLTALGLGWLGEPTMEVILTPLFHNLHIAEGITHLISIIIAFAIITFLHVVLGELAPKTVAIQKAESVSLLLSKPLILFKRIMYPFIWVLNGAAAMIVRMFGLKITSDHESAHSEEELRLILSESAQRGEINEAELAFVNNIFTFDNLVAREIMIPRTEMICVFQEKSMEENIEIMQHEKFTRYPVAVGDKDHIIGVVNIKEVFRDMFQKEINELSYYVRPLISVIETMPVKELLMKMQEERMHMALLVDEYGGTSGIVTAEDILEEIVGDIKDEFDEDEINEIEEIDERSYIVDGKVLITELNSLLGLDLPHTDYDTIAGWLMNEIAIIKEGSILLHESYEFTVVKIDGHQIKAVKISKLNEL
jgi:CBS domain containing-hemolysin-like protein